MYALQTIANNWIVYVARQAWILQYVQQCFLCFVELLWFRKIEHTYMTQIAKEKINYNQGEKDYKESLLTIRNINSTFDYPKKLTFERLTYRSHSLVSFYIILDLKPSVLSKMRWGKYLCSMYLNICIPCAPTRTINQLSTDKILVERSYLTWCSLSIRI